MSVGIIGRKIGMTQIFNEDGVVIPVTVVEAGPCYILEQKNQDKHGYDSVLLGYQDKKYKHVNKPEKGFYDKLNAEVKETVLPKKVLKEFRLETKEEFNIGDQVKVDIFAEGDFIDVQAKSKGRGFAGAIKRHNFHRGPMGHGSRYHRRPGSMGGCADPGKVFKGKKLPGQYGSKPITIQNLKVVKVDMEENLLLVKGAIPGPTNGVVYINRAVKKKNKK